MKNGRKSIDRATFGDFQTPLDLALEVAGFVSATGTAFPTVVEPTCGQGSFLQAALQVASPRECYGFDINPDYVRETRAKTKSNKGPGIHVQCEDFYTKDWKAFFSTLAQPILIVGNPPWVTNSALGAMRGNNLPAKSNFQRHQGFAAKTGKANFDISEWMLIRLLESLRGIHASIAMLCKTATARKVLRHAWTNSWDIGPSSLHTIDAAKHFGVAVDACLFVTHTGNKNKGAVASKYNDISLNTFCGRFGLCGRDLVSDVDTYRELSDIDGLEYRRWRSGVKHDAAKIMELTRSNSGLVNGFNEMVTLEDERLFPLLKSSDLANGRLTPSKYVLLTQNNIGDETDGLKDSLPQTWRYLLAHAENLDARRSAIYANRPRFSVFGVGSYTFAPYKVAISGLYKNMIFRAVGCCEGKPIVVDDTCYFLPCETKREAKFFADLLNSEIASRFISSLVFPDAKRPITIDVLRRVDLKKIAAHLGRADEAKEYLSSPALDEHKQSLLVFEQGMKYRARKDRRIK